MRSLLVWYISRVVALASVGVFWFACKTGDAEGYAVAIYSILLAIYISMHETE